MKLKVTFGESESKANATLNKSRQGFTAGFSGGIPYTGEYEVTPKIEAQELKTANRHMKQDVTIHAIPYYEVDNEHNGQTIVIGGN